MKLGLLFSPLPLLKVSRARALLWFSLIGGACVPFGIDQGSVKGNKRLVIEGTRKNNFGVGNKTRQICFNNIKAP